MGQESFVIILGCSDSRVPAEIIFDQRLGDLFVIRVAGNIVAPSQIGSVEFAAERYGTRLVVVLGHSACGAVVATLEELKCSTREGSPNLRSIVDQIRPAVETLLETGLLDCWEYLVPTIVGAGTPAPWAPPQRLVVRGPYRHVRNPMIASVLLMLGAESLFFGSWHLVGWLLVFFLGNAIYFPLVEERALERRFGNDYRLYKANVPRWIPSWRSWDAIDR